MDKNFTITFFVYSYNHEKYIKEAIQAAFEQDTPPDEIILSDDCSSDDTFEIMQSMAKKYLGPAKIILNRNEKNLGISGHLNKLSKMGTGEWFVLCAGDDISAPERLTVLTETINKYPNAKFIATGFNVINEDGKFLYYQGFNEIMPYPTGATGAWHRDCFDYFGPITEQTSAEDVVIPFRALLSGQVVMLNQATINYRVHSKSVSSPVVQDVLQSWEHLAKIKGQLINACGQRLKDMDLCKDKLPTELYNDLKEQHKVLIKGFNTDIKNISVRCNVLKMTFIQKLHYLFHTGEEKHKSFFYRMKTFLISFSLIRKMMPATESAKVRDFISEKVKVLELSDLVKPETGLLIYL